MKKLLLHSCCAPCSSAVLERLAAEWQLTIYYCNPNIDTITEFQRRASELDKLKALKIDFDTVVETYKPDDYAVAVKGLENLGEGSPRCFECYKLRLSKTAEYAKKHGFDAFATTLSISPYKNATWLSEIGRKLGQVYHVPYLDENFKKQNGYQRSLELSYQLKLYRQNYCGCKYSRAEAAGR
jgi:predicted adenine nucleotide alpha hydrolase (AANH) superfamily ATPase